MPIAIDYVNQFASILAALPAEADALAEHAAGTLYSVASDRCPVETGEMKDSIKVEKISDGEYEVSVQKEAALSGEWERTYALYVNGGTWKMRPQPFFSDACFAAAEELMDGSYGRVFHGGMGIVR